ncbi:TolC family protein [Kangiella geojedonensis]|uniref:Cation efflux protein n=1 Tax=Kangiella geojedonensis TaxID=914150 RepID=A0A0F6RC18_9GAMM|nr:TolC family protein [Kangiella geojedonensis]AKE52033.1 Cation efflux protein [Kangiella geojedonensis]
MSTLKSAILLVAALLFSSVTNSQAETNGYGYTLESTLIMAIENDPWLRKSQFKELSLLSQAESQASLPDPKASINLANLPVDDFSFNSQPMTQFKLGFSQTFARGDSLDLKREINQLQASVEPTMRINRKNQLIMVVGALWLDVHKAQQSIALINDKKYLFEELREAAEISYTSALSQTSQQVIIRADLELAKLDDQVTVYSDKLHTSIRQLSEYIQLPQSYLSDREYGSVSFVSQSLPRMTLIEKKDGFQQHPLIKSVDQSIKASQKVVNLKKQSYKPQFTVNGSYAFREDAADGMQRPDFFSLGVSFDIPLFTGNKQDLDVQSAVYDKEAKLEEKALLLNHLMSAYNTELSRLNKLKERHKLYSESILPQVKHQGEASMNAYSNNEADFAELVRARIDEVNVQLTALDIAVEIEKTKLRANYYQAKTPSELLAQISSSYKTTDVTDELSPSNNPINSGDRHE